MATDHPGNQWRGLARRRQIWLPTWRGCLLLACLAGLGAWVLLHALYPFLAVSAPVPGGVMVLEGWMPDASLRAAVEEYRRGHYQRLYITGGPITQGGPLSLYKTFPELAGAVLLKMGMNSNEMVIVPAPGVARDRTYTSGIYLTRWWRSHQVEVTRVNLVSVGPHARRSRLMFEQALGPGVQVGVTALPPLDFNPDRWWRTSEGFRTVTSEAIAYLYARFFFRTPRAADLPPVP